MEPSSLHERLQSILGHETYRAIGEHTGFHAENVRRYMQGQTPPLQFLAAVCAMTGVSADWLLTGKDSPRAREARTQPPRDAAPESLLVPLIQSIESLSDRLERLERYVQSLEARLRAPQSPPTPQHHEQPKPQPEPRARRAPDNKRAASVADALPKRPRPPAR